MLCRLRFVLAIDLSTSLKQSNYYSLLSSQGCGSEVEVSVVEYKINSVVYIDRLVQLQ